MLERFAPILLAVAFAGCMQPAPQLQAPANRDDSAAARKLARAEVAERARRLALLLDETPDAVPDAATLPAAFGALRIVGMDEGPVPDFELTALGGARYSSRALVGQQPFVAVFFATWCDYCGGELKTLERALREVGPMLVIPVSADTAETWQNVPAYLASFGIHQPAVSAHQYPRFSVAYDPFDTVPALVIVGRNGGLVDYHVGYDPAHAERLIASLRLAKTVAPLTVTASR